MPCTTAQAPPWPLMECNSRTFSLPPVYEYTFPPWPRCAIQNLREQSETIHTLLLLELVFGGVCSQLPNESICLEVKGRATVEVLPERVPRKRPTIQKAKLRWKLTTNRDSPVPPLQPIAIPLRSGTHTEQPFLRPANRACQTFHSCSCTDTDLNFQTTHNSNQMHIEAFFYPAKHRF